MVPGSRAACRTRRQGDEEMRTTTTRSGHRSLLLLPSSFATHSSQKLSGSLHTNQRAGSERGSRSRQVALELSQATTSAHTRVSGHRSTLRQGEVVGARREQKRPFSERGVRRGRGRGSASGRKSDAEAASVKAHRGAGESTRGCRRRERGVRQCSAGAGGRTEGGGNREAGATTTTTLEPLSGRPTSPSAWRA